MKKIALSICMLLLAASPASAADMTKAPLLQERDLPIVRPKGFEPLTVRLEGVCSIQLSYVDITLNHNNKDFSLWQAILFAQLNRAYT